MHHFFKNPSISTHFFFRNVDALYNIHKIENLNLVVHYHTLLSKKTIKF